MIAFSCTCGKRYQVKNELAGKRAKCSCGKTLVIPRSAAVTEMRAQSTPPSARATAEDTRVEGQIQASTRLPEPKSSQETSEGQTNTTTTDGASIDLRPSMLFLKSLGAFAVAALAIVFTKIVPANAFGGLSNMFGYTAATIACLGGTAFLIGAVGITVSSINKRRRNAIQTGASGVASALNDGSAKSRRVEILRRAVAAVDRGDFMSAAAILEESEMPIDKENAANCRNICFGGSPQLADMCRVVLSKHLELAETCGH